jgi:hypothetical protein
MILNKNIRAWIGNHQFLKEIKKVERKREIISFDDANKIGILYDATDERDSETIKNYVKNTRANFKKEILAVGYIDKKIVGNNQYAQVGIDYFTKKDLNFSMKPDNIIVNNFIREEFDILINLNSGKCYPLKYISAMSRARFRVGRFSSSNSVHLDMMVKLSGDPPLKIVIEEIEHFLRLIKKK